MNVLVIVPHMDDEVLGAGGTICKHVTSGDRVKVLFLANRVYGHQFDQGASNREESHALEAKSILNYQEIEFARLPDEQLREHFVELLTAIEKAIAGFAPEVVYLNHRNDPHQDHKAVFEAAHISLRTISRHLPNRLQRIACYEVPSSTDQAPPFTEYAFLPNYYVDITPYLEKKKQAMACYETESRPFPHARSAEGIAALAKVRGMASNLSAAEAFVIVREEWP